MKKLILFLLTCILITSCTDNQRARRYGGTETIQLKPNEEFINISWKEADLWIITRDTISNIYYAREKSSFGIWEGSIKIYLPPVDKVDNVKSIPVYKDTLKIYLDK